MTVIVSADGEEAYGEATTNPIPEPSAITMMVTAIAVSAPAITALQDTPLHPAAHPAPAGEVITATLSPTIVVSSMRTLSQLFLFRARAGNLQTGYRGGYGILPSNCRGSPCEPSNAVTVPQPCGLCLIVAAQHFRFGTFPPHGIFNREVKSNRPDPETARPVDEKGIAMLNLVVTLLIIALIAAVLGFGGIASAAVGIAKIVFLVALVLFVIAAIAGTMRTV